MHYEGRCHHVTLPFESIFTNTLEHYFDNITHSSSQAQAAIG